jgi:hypothetical protein
MIILPDHLWTLLLKQFQRTRRRVEQVAYLDGIALDDRLMVVTTLVFPNADLHPRHFTVAAAAMSEAGQHFRQFGLQRLAQVHTHPKDWVDHSDFDDSMAYSQHPGALSIVVPHHGKDHPALYACGIHLRTERDWVRLQGDQISDHIRVVPGFLDFRKWD